MMGSTCAQSNLPACPSSGYLHNCFGAFTLTNGAKYVGEFKDNKFNVQGTYTFANGNKYVGEFKDGKLHGQGIYYLANGSISQSGIWSDNRLVTAQYVDPDEYQRNIAQRQESERKAEEDKRIQADEEAKVKAQEAQAKREEDARQKALAAGRVITDACISAAKEKYDYDNADKYGNSTAVKVTDFQFLQLIVPGGHPYGNNFSYLFVARHNRIKNNALHASDVKSITIDCVVNNSGKVIGIEGKIR
jgi:hypothetical protein